MLKLLRNVRKALKQWQALSPEERDRHKRHVDHIQSLVAELGGKQALGYVDGSHDEIDDEEHTVTTRPRADVIADLQAETTNLLLALAVPATALARDSVPLSARLGGKVASKGFHRFAHRDAQE
jgi:hypothetical protein